MKKILIHIGLHKTATTWLQNEVFISEGNVFEPLSKKDKNKGHSSLAKDFIFDGQGNLLNSHDDNTERINASLESILNQREKHEKTFVMSHERLSGYPHSSGFDSAIIARRIKNIFPNAKILIVIREQVSCILSNYFESLKEGGTLNLKQYLNTKYDGRSPGFSPNYFKYHFLIEFYQAQFGKDNVLVLPFELVRDDKKSFLNILSEFMEENINLNPQVFNTKYNLKENHYINFKLRKLNNYILSSSSLNGASGLQFHFLKVASLKLKDILYPLTPKKWDENLKTKLHQDIENWASGKFTESNKITSQLIGLNLETYGYV